MRRVAYDLDGVLHSGPPAPSKPHRFQDGKERRERKLEMLAAYRSGGVLFNPPEDHFFVITARKAEDDVREVTQRWLNLHFSTRVLGIFMLDQPRTLDNVALFKGGVLLEHAIQEFTEDNVQILRRLHKQVQGSTRLFVYSTDLGKRPYEPRKGKASGA